MWFGAVTGSQLKRNATVWGADKAMGRTSEPYAVLLQTMTEAWLWDSGTDFNEV
jgi:hypothetical protein|tara:strand:- start:204 stop:365 length:162 start_codon:yes stop_codon:yes gene_type:complete